MRIRLLTSRVGDRFSQQAGDVIDLPDDEARRLLVSEQAERVEQIETATQPRGENKMSPRGKRR